MCASGNGNWKSDFLQEHNKYLPINVFRHWPDAVSQIRLKNRNIFKHKHIFKNSIHTYYDLIVSLKVK